ncbi:MAG TPA: spermidine/putrescine ABC transporter substrate-binding protein, partial [Gemmatimonadales bacterium]
MSKRTEVQRLVEQLERGGVSRREFMSRALALGLSVSSIGLLLNACKGKGGGAGAAGDSTAADAAMADLGPMEKELHLYNWSDYIAEDTVPNFEKEFGIKVTYDTYESNEEMVAKLQAGASGYDIVVPSGYIIPVLVATDLITPLNKKYVTNIGNISPIFRNLPSDPGDKYTVPWQWGTTGIAYRTDKVKTPVDSWDVFHDKKFAKKLTMMDDGREVIGAELRHRGHSLNSIDPKELAQAKADCI